MWYCGRLLTFQRSMLPPSSFRVKVETAWTSETLRCHNPEGLDLKYRRHESLAYSSLDWKLQIFCIITHWLYTFKNLALKEGELSISRSVHFTPGKMATCTLWKRDWVDPSGGLDMMVIRRNPTPNRNWTSITQLLASHSTVWAHPVGSHSL